MRVEITKRAHHQIVKNAEAIGKLSQQGAQNWINSIFSAIEKVGRDPSYGHIYLSWPIYMRYNANKTHMVLFRVKRDPNGPFVQISMIRGHRQKPLEPRKS
jgi:hypothetical protein